ncbi:hypothetical protein ONR07_24645, partial [Salmonella enterica subsp. enterica serovar Anatum]|nr:hypothetical protein [Salmonella enterica subsp. enterica serovar Anatum]
NEIGMVPISEEEVTQEDVENVVHTAKSVRVRDEHRVLHVIPQGRCHISFVKERGTTPLQKDIPPRLFLSGGIRNNVWRTFSTR